jgi:hypothetical protein
VNGLQLPPEQSLRRIRIRVELALVEVNQLFADLQDGADPKTTVRRMIMALGRISPVLEDLDGILAEALLAKDPSPRTGHRAARAVDRA